MSHDRGGGRSRRITRRDGRACTTRLLRPRVGLRVHERALLFDKVDPTREVAGEQLEVVEEVVKLATTEAKERRRGVTKVR